MNHLMVMKQAMVNHSLAMSRDSRADLKEKSSEDKRLRTLSQIWLILMKLQE